MTTTATPLRAVRRRPFRQPAPGVIDVRTVRVVPAGPADLVCFGAQATLVETFDVGGRTAN